MMGIKINKFLLFIIKNKYKYKNNINIKLKPNKLQSNIISLLISKNKYKNK